MQHGKHGPKHIRKYCRDRRRRTELLKESFRKGCIRLRIGNLAPVSKKILATFNYLSTEEKLHVDRLVNDCINGPFYDKPDNENHPQVVYEKVSNLLEQTENSFHLKVLRRVSELVQRVSQSKILGFQMLCEKQETLECPS